MKTQAIAVGASLVAALFLSDSAGAQKAPAARKPNEVGRIPIVMYHSIGDRGAFDRNGLNISAATFRKHLTMMADAGWYPMNVRDLYDPKKLAAVPVGMTPVALTFDDSRGSQFHYKKDGAIDPNCAVGILEAFHRKRGEKWPRAASFYVLPRSSYNPTPFWQAGLEKKKLQFLVDSGYEVGNHSYAHKFMSGMGAAQVREAVWGCVRDIQKLCPDATMDTFCVPYGAYPRSSKLWAVILKDPQGQYTNRIALKAWGDESYSPLDSRFDPREVNRFGVNPGYFERQFARLKKSPLLYVSDGDSQTVSAPRSQEKWIAKSRLGGTKLALWGDAPAIKKPTNKIARASSKTKTIKP